jgi:hypothetical protein
LVENVKIQKDKEIKIGLFGLKEDYLINFQKYLEKLFEKFKTQQENIEFNLVFKSFKMVEYDLT